MKSYDFNAYTNDASVYCLGCGPDPQCQQEGSHPIFANEEWDYIPTCDECGAEHDYVVLLSADDDDDDDTCPYCDRTLASDGFCRNPFCEACD